MHISHGGLQHSTVRYYDGVNRRPGLPDSVGALVHRIEPELVEIELVNLDLTASRTVIVQAGSFGEHRFGVASEGAVAGGVSEVTVGGRWLEVVLAPGAGTRLTITMERYVNEPSYETPWSRREDWAPLIKPRQLDA